MKKYIVFLILLFCTSTIFQSCGQAEEEIIMQNYPKIDGSTSSLPIIQGIYKAMYKPEIIDGEKEWSGLPETVSQTIESYKMLIDGTVDLIIVPDPSEEVQKLAEEKSVELEYIPICLEALVFITHKSMPVDDITTEELRNIYIDGTITNWQQLGGKDKKIMALVRNEDSGSHALMEKFVLKGDKLSEAVNENNMMMTMIAMVEKIENFVNAQTAVNLQDDRDIWFPLGYTIYYYLQNNKDEQKWDNVMMLNVDRVKPNDETIASGEYPYTTNYYAVVRKDTPSDSTSRKLISWLLSNEGQKIITNAGFGNIKQ